MFVLAPSLQTSTMLLLISACCQLFSISTAAGCLITRRLSPSFSPSPSVRKSLSDLLPAETSLNKPITMLRLSVQFILMRLSRLGWPSLRWQHGKTSFFHTVFWVHVKGRFTRYCCRYSLISPSPQQKWSAMRAVLSSEGLISNTASDSGSQPSWATMKGSVRTNKSPGRQANLEESS